MNSCISCGASLLLRRAGAKTCSAVCRKRLSRGSGIPSQLRGSPRWVRFSRSKVPLTVAGAPASSTDPRTWATFTEAQCSDAGVGMGFVLNGDGIGCYDLDHVLTGGVLSPGARAFIDSVAYFYAEVSPSGDGVHLWVHAPAGRGWKRTVDGVSVEFYTQGRYMTVTGRQFR